MYDPASLLRKPANMLASRARCAQDKQLHTHSLRIRHDHIKGTARVPTLKL